jgi:hypothetical protein
MKSIPLRRLHFIQCISLILQPHNWKCSPFQNKWQKVSIPFPGIRCVSIDCKLISVRADWRLSQPRRTPNSRQRRRLMAKFITAPVAAAAHYQSGCRFEFSRRLSPGASWLRFSLRACVRDLTLRTPSRCRACEDGCMLTRGGDNVLKGP